MKSTEEKQIVLSGILSEAGTALIAFSGGTDSSYLLYEASRIKSLRLMAITIRTPYMHSDEIADAVSFCLNHHIPHRVIDMEIPVSVITNPVDRCYKCKKEIIRIISDIALAEKYENIFDGTNSDDLSDYRPGMKALKEHGVRSPMVEAELTKKEIRELSEKEGLASWDKPANACLLTRFPHETEITVVDLEKAKEAETFLSSVGFRGSRVRVHGDLARIECRSGQFESVMEPQTREIIVNKLKSLGYKYITIDLEGYVTGKMNCKPE